jgi:hypothetical protein
VLAYQAWTYWVFRARITPNDTGYGEGTIGRVREALSKP